VRHISGVAVGMIVGAGVMVGVGVTAGKLTVGIGIG
jgi:hypothetical protein